MLHFRNIWNRHISIPRRACWILIATRSASTISTVSHLIYMVFIKEDLKLAFVGRDSVIIFSLITYQCNYLTVTYMPGHDEFSSTVVIYSTYFVWHFLSPLSTRKMNGASNGQNLCDWNIVRRLQELRLPSTLLCYEYVLVLLLYLALLFKSYQPILHRTSNMNPPLVIPKPTHMQPSAPTCSRNPRLLYIPLPSILISIPVRSRICIYVTQRQWPAVEKRAISIGMMDMGFWRENKISDSDVEDYGVGK